MEEKKQYCTPQSICFDLDEDESVIQTSGSSAEAIGSDMGSFDDETNVMTINFNEPLIFNDNPY